MEGIEWMVGVCYVGYFLLIEFLFEWFVVECGGCVVFVFFEGYKSLSIFDWECFFLMCESFKLMVVYG